MFEQMRSALGKQSDLVLVVVVVCILMILFTPIPPMLLDVLIIMNLSFGLLILLLTFYVEKPVQFSTFPSLLLIATLFRLALNIAATRLILSEGDAGEVINAIGTHVVSGNYVIGLIVFVVLIVVQYVVITNGAQRVAEVAARFTLDSMPGKQMSIDADMNIGIIDEKEAQARRKEIEQEGGFYGAMDGASKFVKGDAIAGIIIILIDIIGGLTIGLAQLGMSWSDALETYTLLTIGDGIVTQIPALIISTGTGIIVTRAATGQSLSKDISSQIISYPKTLMIVMCGLFLMLLLPGLPVFPVIIVMMLVGGMYWASKNVKKREKTQELNEEDEKSEEGSTGNLYADIKVDPVVVQVSVVLGGILGGENSPLVQRISTFRKQYAMSSGFVLPQVKIQEESSLEEGGYRILIFGVQVAQSYVKHDGVMAIDPGNAKRVIEGVDTKDPSFGLPAKWIEESEQINAREAGYTVVDAITVLMTHVSEILKQKTPDLLTRKETENLLDALRKYNPSLLDELIPGVMSIGLVRKVLASLLEEKVSIRNLERILEVLVDEGRKTADPAVLGEMARRQLSSVIFQGIADGRAELQSLVLDPVIEKTVSTSINEGRLILDPKYAEQLLIRIAGQVENMVRSNHPPVLVCSAELRHHISALVRRMIPQLHIISMAEIPSNATVKSFSVVTI
jgi:flagellar biosynthesis protein FlhA